MATIKALQARIAQLLDENALLEERIVEAELAADQAKAERCAPPVGGAGTADPVGSWWWAPDACHPGHVVMPPRSLPRDQDRGRAGPPLPVPPPPTPFEDFVPTPIRQEPF